MNHLVNCRSCRCECVLKSDADAAVAEARFTDETIDEHAATLARLTLGANKHVLHLRLVGTVQQHSDSAVSLRHDVVLAELNAPHTDIVVTLRH